MSNDTWAPWIATGVLLTVVALCCIALVALHELGHGLVALALQPGRVTLYLGSHGLAAGGGRLQRGRLRLYFRYNPWRLAVGGGLCRPQYSVLTGGGTWRGLVYVLAGPLLPLAVASLAAGLMLRLFPDASNAAKAIPVLFFWLTLLSAMFNLLPSRRAITLAHGGAAHNDGTAVHQLLQYDRALRGARAADAAYEAGDYAQSTRLDELLLGRLGPSAVLFRRLVRGHFLLHAYAPALTVSRQFEHALPAEFDDNDLFGQALLLSRLGRHPEALALYSALVARPAPYVNAYNNRGYTHNVLGEYELAITDFDQVLALAAAAGTDVSYAHINRGLARLKLGQEAAGLADIAHGLRLDPQNAYGYRNLGIHQLDQGHYPEALRLLEQAYQLDPHTHLLSDYLSQARQQVANSGAGPAAPYGADG